MIKNKGGMKLMKGTKKEGSHVYEKIQTEMRDCVQVRQEEEKGSKGITD